jgi:hypothetical protein
MFTENGNCALPPTPSAWRGARNNGDVSKDAYIYDTTLSFPLLGTICRLD